eukprot:3152834-Pyramimonas_sp.AAC.2
MGLTATLAALHSSNAPAAAEAAKFVARIISDAAQDGQYPPLLTDNKTIGALLKLAQNAPGKPLYLRAAAASALLEYCSNKDWWPYLKLTKIGGPNTRLWTQRYRAPATGGGPPRTRGRARRTPARGGLHRPPSLHLRGNGRPRGGGRSRLRCGLLVEARPREGVPEGGARHNTFVTPRQACGTYGRDTFVTAQPKRFI